MRYTYSRASALLIDDACICLYCLFGKTQGNDEGGSSHFALKLTHICTLTCSILYIHECW